MLYLDELSTLVTIGLLVFCLIDCLQTPADEIRGLSKGWWLVLIILPLVGGIAWLVAGRPTRDQRTNAWRMGSGFPESQRPRADRPPVGPDDDDAFLSQLKKVDTEHEDTLNRWEADLRRREAERRRRESEE